MSIRDQDRKMVVLLRLAAEAVLKAREKEFRKFGVSLEEWAVLFITKSVGEKTTPAEISRWMFREHHSVTALLERMEKKGLLTKTKDLERRNMVRVTLTDKGEKIYRISRKEEVPGRILSSLSEEERQELTQHLNTLRSEAFQELGIDYKPPFP